MFKYAIVEISGRQYKITPDSSVEVDKLDIEGKFTCDKVLLMVDDQAILVGKPYLKETLDFEVLDQKRGRKIRVATYHAKANYRRIKGGRHSTTVVGIAGAKKVVKEDKVTEPEVVEVSPKKTVKKAKA